MRSVQSLLALQSLPGIGQAKARQLVGASEEPPGYDAALLNAKDALEREQDIGVAHIGYYDSKYPALLRCIPSPPLVLRVRGQVASLSQAALAVVGTRKPTLFGLSAVEVVIAKIAAEGFGIVSGLALGIDSAAHRAALKEGLTTVAVLGGGVERPYPAENRALAEEILLSGGALVAEVACGVTPSARTLVARNRIQTGLALAVFIGQTGLRGGTLHTARFAAEQGKPIWCPVPTPSGQAGAGLSALLELPADSLPDRLPAFAGAKRLMGKLGAVPLARPLSREGLDAFLCELRELGSALGYRSDSKGRLQISRSE